MRWVQTAILVASWAFCLASIWQLSEALEERQETIRELMGALRQQTKNFEACASYLDDCSGELEKCRADDTLESCYRYYLRGSR